MRVFVLSTLACFLLALDLERKNSGNASVMVGFFQLLFGGLTAPTVGIGNVVCTPGLVMFVGSVAAMGLVLGLRWHNRTTTALNTAYVE